jgi:hypothetical protein
MELQNQIVVSATPAVITANFDELKSALSKELERYDVTVTEETVADAKKLCTELNKTKSHIAKVRKEQAALASEPVRIFEEQMKEFELDVAEARSKLLSQVQYFEQERKDTLRALLLDYRLECWQQIGLRVEFQQTEIDDLVIISNITAKNNLTAKAKSTIESRVQEQKSIQDRIDRRLLELENKCLRAGMTEPLERAHIESFLFSDDEGYDRQLDHLIGIELEREERAERVRKAREEKARQQEVSQPEIANEAPAVESTPEAPKEAAIPANGKISLSVVCEFDIEVPATTPFETIEAAYRKRIEDAGFKTLSRVSISEK